MSSFVRRGTRPKRDARMAMTDAGRYKVLHSQRTKRDTREVRHTRQMLEYAGLQVP